MALQVKSRDDVNDAIAKFLANDGVVKKPRPDCKNLKNDTWRGSKVTVGFKMELLRDNTEIKNV
jgi:hypothetical protein